MAAEAAVKEPLKVAADVTEVQVRGIRWRAVIEGSPVAGTSCLRPYRRERLRGSQLEFFDTLTGVISILLLSGHPALLL